MAHSSLVERLLAILDKENNLSESLRQSIFGNISTEAVITVCGQCKKIRNNKGDWQHGSARDLPYSLISHGYCPECAHEFMEAAGLKKCRDWSFRNI